MLTFKSTSLLFILSLALCGLLIYFFSINPFWLLLPILIFKLTIIYGSATIQSNFYLKAYNTGNTAKKHIAITFDDGPTKEFTPEILKVLAEYNAKASFYVIGKNILGNENLVQQIHQEGHLLGNHSFSHSFFIDFKSSKGFVEEINQTTDALEKIIGKRTTLFRPPYGVTTPNIATAVNKLKMHVIGWNVRSLDTTKDDAQTIVNRVTLQLKPGAIVLFHDTSKKTVNVLKQTLNFAKENGFKIVSIDELLNIKAYE
ncbi:MAG: polysaccharide deacetylase family protein [Bacteroidia bacterium]|nr:polysaccharide deacetylase family protein [Bacteroidia bacterium]